MGTHPASREHFDWSRTDCDIWVFNEAANLKNEKGGLAYPKVDAVIQLHHKAIWKNPKNRSDEEHYQWLISGKTPTVYMQKAYKEVPKAVKYPIEKVLSLVENIKTNINGRQKDFKYFSSSPDFALALVAFMWKQGKKYKRVEIWGIELETESEYQYQRTGFGFWTGYLTALGVNLVVYSKVFETPMYGYEGDVAVTSADIEKRLADLTLELGTDKDQYNLEANNFLKSMSGLLRKDVSASIMKELGEIISRGEQAGILNGKIKESTRYLEKALAMEKASGASVFSLGEFDSVRLVYTMQADQVRADIANTNIQIPPLLKKLLILKKGSQKRQRAIDEFGNLVAQLMNKNMLLFHIVGAERENRYYVDSLKLSYRAAGGAD